MAAICEYPNGVILKTCEPWEPSVIDPYGLQGLIADMKAVCALHKGQGLAANQIGVLKRVIIFQDNQGQMQSLVNPEILELGSETSTAMEGCLSLPGLQVKVTRPTEITVTGLTENLEPVTLVSEGLEARCIHHEIDHLNGVLIVDHQGRLNRKMTLDKWMKLRKKLDRAEMSYLNRELKRAA
jgi:peptide deformylase